MKRNYHTLYIKKCQLLLWAHKVRTCLKPLEGSVATRALRGRLPLLMLCMVLCCSQLWAQDKQLGKLSPMLKRAVFQNPKKDTRSTSRVNDMQVMALVKCTNPDVLIENGCKTWKNWGNIYATSIPMRKLRELTQYPEILRIEAGQPCQVCVDTTATILGVTQLWKGLYQPVVQANEPKSSLAESRATGEEYLPWKDGLSGKGVVMGIQDIGFDLTHPNFYSRDMKRYRIKAFWDMLDTDTIGSSLFVGRDYTDSISILSKAHATDGQKMTHGVHTAGIAAGSGYDSPYIGMAPEAELCLVSNAVGGDAEFISEADQYKYTTATDMMGFQYIFDYAESVGKPCVISFSEGAHEDLYGDAQLLYEVLDEMTGPGKIVVASAGNSSVNKTYLHKPIGIDSISSFIYSNSEAGYYTIRHKEKTDISLHFSTKGKPAVPFYTKCVSTDEICMMEDSLWQDTLHIGEEDYLLLMASYPSCYNSDEWATELYIKILTQKYLGNGNNHRIRIVLQGKDNDVECFASGGLFKDENSCPEYQNAVSTHNINFPAAAPCVIAVGGTAYRTGAHNFYGKWKDYNMGDDGRRWEYSSVGPTMQGLTKPDVMAPACNVISSYSSYYIEKNPLANDVDWDVKHFKFNGREYSWNCNSGTSMSSPVVGGIVALWLELCPSLTPQQVMEVIRETSKRYDPALPYPNNEYGWGEIDALEGARYIKAHFDCTNGWNDYGTEIREKVTEQMIDLSGRSMPRNSTTHGIYLIKYSNGQTRKVVK